MARVGDRAERSLQRFGPFLLVEGLPDGAFDEAAAIAGTDALVELSHELIIDAYVQSHGHRIAHTTGHARYQLLDKRLRRSSGVCLGQLTHLSVPGD
jgi:hypothetical protein